MNLLTVSFLNFPPSDHTSPSQTNSLRARPPAATVIILEGRRGGVLGQSKVVRAAGRLCRGLLGRCKGVGGI